MAKLLLAFRGTNGRRLLQKKQCFWFASITAIDRESEEVKGWNWRQDAIATHVLTKTIIAMSDSDYTTIDSFPMFCGRNATQYTKPRSLSPKIISYYSVTWDEDKKRRDFDNDDRANLRILLPYSYGVPYDVLDGYEGIKEGQSFLPSPDKLPLARILRHLVEGRARGIPFERSKNDRRPIPYDFVTKRKVLYRIMVLSQNSTNCEDQLEMFAQKYKGTIYIAYNTSGLERERYKARSEQANRGSYAGLKFKDHLTKFAYEPKGGVDDFRRLKNTFNCVFSAKFGRISVLYAGGMDTAHNRRSIQGRTLEGKDFVQIKTVSARFKGKERELRAKKYRFWWAKCYLSGSHALIFGYLTEKNGGTRMTIDQVEYVTTNMMTKAIGERQEEADEIDASGDVNSQGLVDHTSTPWKAGNSIGRLTYFLQFLRNKLEDATEDELYNIRWNRGDRFYTVTKTTVEHADPRKIIIRDDFKRKFHWKASQKLFISSHSCFSMSLLSRRLWLCLQISLST